MSPRILIASDFNAGDRAHFALSYEFCRIITECDDADLVAPGIDDYVRRRFGRFLPAHDEHNVQRDFNRLVNGFRKSIGLRNRPTIQPVELTKDYDLFFFVAWSPQSLVELSRIKNWRSRCKIAAVYLFELWSSTLQADSSYLRLLDQFDHVFLLHSAAIPHLPAYTSAPSSFLPTAVDGLIATPYPLPPERVVDVYSIGNRAAALHKQLLALAQRRKLFYVYDSLSSTDSRVKEWSEHRLLLANMIKRTRYFMAFNPASLDNAKAGKIAGEHVLPARLFEGAAGGAVILGTAPQCAEFQAYFDWPDAVIEVPPTTADIGAVIEELDAQPDRVDQIRRTNAVRCLLQHDWVHRWEQVLVTVGLRPRPELEQRKAKLNAIAASAMSDPPYAVGTAWQPDAARALHTDSWPANSAYSRRTNGVHLN